MFFVANNFHKQKQPPYASTGAIGFPLPLLAPGADFLPRPLLVLGGGSVSTASTDFILVPPRETDLPLMLLVVILGTEPSVLSVLGLGSSEGLSEMPVASSPLVKLVALGSSPGTTTTFVFNLKKREL